jgi:hypothetical protein
MGRHEGRPSLKQLPDEGEVGVRELRATPPRVA